MPQVAVPYYMFELGVGRMNEIDPESVNRIGSGAELLRCATGRGCRPGKEAVRGSTMR